MISEEHAKSLFTPVKQELTKIILESWKKIHASELNFKSRSRASLMWDETFYKVNIAWGGSGKIEHIEEKNSQTAHYWLDNKTFFRIKKGDKKGYTQNYPTQAALEFHVEESDLYPLARRLEVTYVLNPDETSIVDIAVVHRVGKIVDFRFSLLDEANIRAMPISDKSSDKNGSVTKLKPGIAEELREAESDE